LCLCPGQPEPHFSSSRFMWSWNDRHVPPCPAFIGWDEVLLFAQVGLEPRFFRSLPPA
jgi:hypothetical protein